MTLYLAIQRKKYVILIDAKDDTQIFEVKKIIEEIIKVSPEKQRLFTKDKEVMDDARTLSDYGYNTNSAQCIYPGKENGEFESFNVELHSPPGWLGIST